MATYQSEFHVSTRGKGFSRIDPELRRIVRASNITTGTCHAFVCHTSASLVIQENADPAVLRDLERWFADLAPESRSWEHSDEGPDDMPAHARTVLTRTSETLPVTNGELVSGTWQGLFLWEHRAMPHRRRVVVTLLGE